MDEKIRQLLEWRDRSMELTGMMMGHPGADNQEITVREFHDIDPEERMFIRQYAKLDEEFDDISRKIRNEAFWMVDYIEEISQPKYYVEKYLQYYPTGGMSDISGPYATIERAREIEPEGIYITNILIVQNNIIESLINIEANNDSSSDRS